MTSYYKKLDELKVKLFRLHFLLTEEQTEQAIADGVEQFQICFSQAMECLDFFIETEYKQKAESNDHLLQLSLEHKLFNQSMIDSMKKMLADYDLVQKGKNIEKIYPVIKESYARYLQMVLDMLTHMGEEAEEE
ncbi:MAG: hypothetical protein D8M58_15725 [Calditrichaeota bacterium]|nr:MAG: hypothetical protein DWQ03_07455 [Calditrichota bacterium]MBL1206854.1 hypothetical protein [Calditrichota bacterium]NOG46681.1 hypothetical protein [Calditrichota bacterium]